MWVHNGCSFITESQYELLQNTNCIWICPKCECFNFSNSFFDDQLNLENQNRFDLLTKEKKTGSSEFDTSENNFIGGRKFVSININSIRGKKLELLAFSLTLWLFRKQKLTAPLQLQNCSRNLAHTKYTGKTETFMAAV